MHVHKGDMQVHEGDMQVHKHVCERETVMISEYAICRLDHWKLYPNGRVPRMFARGPE